MLKIRAAGIEYVHVPVEGVPQDAGLLQASFDGGAWLDMEWEDGARARARILVRGPQAETTSGTMLTVGRHVLTVRLVDTPETIVRTAGTVTIE